MAKTDVLFIDYVLLANDVRQEFLARGYSVECVRAADLSVSSFDTACARLNPGFVFSINFSPELAFLATRREIPYLSWTIDPLPAQRFTLYDGTKVEYCRLFCHDQGLVAEFQRLGLTHVSFLPLAAPERRQPVTDPSRLEPWRCGLSFVGQSMIKEKEKAVAALGAAGLTAADLCELGGWLTELATGAADSPGFAGLGAAPELLPARMGHSPAVGKMGLPAMLDLLDGWLAHELRVVRVQALAGLGLQTYGDDGWQGLAAAYRGFAQHQDHLTCIYNASIGNLDLPRVYQRDIITMRVFDVLACAGVVLTEDHSGLRGCFTPGLELLTYTSAADMVQQASRLLALSEQERRAMGEAGRARVLACHQMQHRVTALLASLAGF
ncbi:MAG: hypothetical protein A3K19_27080 [Lentisphaerae bacterium RIFOXYB12_FULL_65_16]|nr:MAG: hypothetical protein A3K18_24455 [Lentisphaerae bacterium RIFOXYA12_64_32]OGV90252.1 MAG: hypothetical protein A3K19_27080 [Lentisphaerae bacterium RIFOXYB12_FULL_65_16]